MERLGICIPSLSINDYTFQAIVCSLDENVIKKAGCHLPNYAEGRVQEGLFLEGYPFLSTIGRIVNTEITAAIARPANMSHIAW